jgi:hypothetical protein
MYFKKPVIVRVRWFADDDMNEAVAELEWVKWMISCSKKDARKEAYTNWLYGIKRLFCCIICGQRDANVLHFHHLGEKFTTLRRSIGTPQLAHWETCHRQKDNC